MSVDLSDLVDTIKREVSPPGTNLFPDSTDDEWLGNLADAFWEARLDGMLALWTCDEDGIVTAVKVGGDDITRDLQQLVVLYASFRVLRNDLRRLRTQFHVAAGPVIYEYQQSAGLLTELIKDVIARRNLILVRLSDVGQVPSFVIDSIIARNESIGFGDTWWTGSGGDPNGLR